MTKNLSHDEALDALCGCAVTVTVLSYEEAIKGYFSLRGWPDPETLSTLTPARAEGFKDAMAETMRRYPHAADALAFLGTASGMLATEPTEAQQEWAIRALKETPDHG